MRTIKRHIIHCSDTPDDKHITAEDIRDWHVKDNGWSDIGYHFIINRDGSVTTGRSVKTTGAHCKGFNSDSIGTCLIGRENFTEDQFHTLRTLDNIIRQLLLGIEETKGHCEYNMYKTCPNFDVEKVINDTV